MANKIITTFFISLAILCLAPKSSRGQTKDKIQIMIVGFDHLSQLDNGTPESDVFGKKKQAEIAELNEDLKQFDADIMMVEREPQEQDQLDSLYERFCSGKLKFSNLEYGSSETYQVGFKTGKMLGLKRIYGINYYESTSQSLLKSGENIETFQAGLNQLQNTARPLKQLVQKDSLSIYDYIAFINKPEMLAMTHYLFYNLPAVVVNGEFDDSATNTVDLGKIDNKYIGAEYITFFYNRNLKIYSNILNTQLQTGKRKLMVLLGQAHVGVLLDLFEDNPNYEIIPATSYLDKNSAENE